MLSLQRFIYNENIYAIRFYKTQQFLIDWNFVRFYFAPVFLCFLMAFGNFLFLRKITFKTWDHVKWS